jgi:hypothetical protein
MSGPGEKAQMSQIQELASNRGHGIAWNPSALLYGVVMFLAFNGLDYLHHPHRRPTDNNKPIWLAISFVVWVGASYAQAEWLRRRFQRQEEEDS